MSDIGLDVQAPQETCEDPNCPFHGSLSVRGQVLQGRVTEIKVDRTVVVERRRLWRLPKFQRYEKRTNHYPAHHPPCIQLTPGDEVTIAECRPLSKTKSFVIIEARRGKLEVHGQDTVPPVHAPKDEEDEEEDEEEVAEDASEAPDEPEPEPEPEPEDSPEAEEPSEEASASEDTPPKEAEET